MLRVKSDNISHKKRIQTSISSLGSDIVICNGKLDSSLDKENRIKVLCYIFYVWRICCDNCSQVKQKKTFTSSAILTSNFRFPNGVNFTIYFSFNTLIICSHTVVLGVAHYCSLYYSCQVGVTDTFSIYLGTGESHVISRT